VLTAISQKIGGIIPYTVEKLKELAIILKNLWDSTFKYFKEIFNTSWKSAEEMFQEFDRSAKELDVVAVIDSV
jgi:hypothetical protein